MAGPSGRSSGRPGAAQPVALGAIAALLLLAAGCGGEAEPTRLSAGDDGRLVEVAPGATIEVRLESNPTTGYAWSLVRRPDEAVLRLVSSELEPAGESDEAVAGRGGTEVWRFEAVAAGTTTLQLAYLRSWEPESPAGSFTLRVRVG